MPAGSEPENPTRRRLLAVLADLLLALPVIGPFLAAFRVAASPSPRTGGGRIPLLPLAKIPEEGLLPFQIDFTRRVGALREEVHRTLYLGRRGGWVWALSSECTHLGCPVQIRGVAGEDPPGIHLACPCHKGTFDLEGRVLGGPPPRDLERLELELPEDPRDPVVLKL